MTGWIDVGDVEDVPARGSRRLTIDDIAIGIFRTADGSLFALHDQCPHKKGRLSDGIIHGHAVACPLHNWSIDLASGQALKPDHGCTKSISLLEENGRILIDTGTLPSFAVV